MTARRAKPSPQLSLFLTIEGGKPEPAITEADIDEMFAEWWQAYPKRVAVKAARKAFGTVIKSGDATPSQLIEGARRYGEECRRRCTEPHYIAHGGTWLNAGRWLDERAAPYSAATASFARIGAEFRAKAGHRG